MAIRLNTSTSWSTSAADVRRRRGWTISQRALPLSLWVIWFYFFVCLFVCLFLFLFLVKTNNLYFTFAANVWLWFISDFISWFFFSFFFLFWFCFSPFQEFIEHVKLTSVQLQNCAAKLNPIVLGFCEKNMGRKVRKGGEQISVVCFVLFLSLPIFFYFLSIFNSFVSRSLIAQVARGECWDLPKYAIDVSLLWKKKWNRRREEGGRKRRNKVKLHVLISWHT